ncbi:MAG: apolipoprotein N-acyltransferase [Nitrospirota bacterium]
MHKLGTKFKQWYGPALLSGLLLVLSFPELEFFPLAWAALVPLFLFLYELPDGAAFKAGFLMGIVYFFGTTYWIYHSVHWYGGIPFIPSLLLVLLLALYLSLYTGVFAALYASYSNKSDMPTLLLAPVLWTTLEYLRSYVLSGFPWASIGYSQYRFLPFIQVSDITGIYGISFLVVAVNGAIADILLFNRRRIKRPLASILPAAAGFTLLALALIFTFAYGAYRLYQTRPGHTVRVAVVQGNIEQDRKWDPAYQQAVVDTYRALSFEAARYNPALIVWPETAVPFYFRTHKEWSDYLVSFQQELNAYLLFGGVTKKSTEAGPAYANSAILLDKYGNTTYIYDKIHLVPFGEFVPLRGLLSVVDLTGAIGDYLPGESYIKAITPFGSFGTLICYEIIFPGMVRKFYARGGDFMVNITNDAWFGRTYGPAQHFSMAVFRAVENRKPLVRSANTGISGFIDSNGRIVKKTGLFERTFSVHDVRTDSTLAPYTKYGDIFAYLCIVGSLLLLIGRINKL